MNGIIEHKSISGELKDIDVEKRIVTGYLSAFGNVDHDGDRIEKGAFSKSILERKNDIYFLNGHDWKQPHGKFSVLSEDEKGLYFESGPLVNTSYSNDLLKLYEAGIVKEHSIGFVTIKSKSNVEGAKRLLQELKLYEGSNVTRGANSNTPFLGTKGLTMDSVRLQTKLIIKAMRDGTFTDDTFVLLELSLKQLQATAFELGKKESLEIEEPSDDTLLKFEPIGLINSFTKSLKI